MSGMRKLTTHVYGLRGASAWGAVVEHLVPGTLFRVAKDEFGETAVFANGRIYPADYSLVHDVMENSVPHAD